VAGLVIHNYRGNVGDNPFWQFVGMRNLYAQMQKHDHTQDAIYMQRALELAQRGRGAVSPNPMVGCVIVNQNRIIGEGWHKKFGGPHAEVHAVESVEDTALLPGSSVYVNLEPCSHHGKTPPCADLLIRSKVARVVVSNLDTNPLVAGTGIKRLREAGIEVITGIREKEGRVLNERFFTYYEKKRPFVILKWAQTADGFIARENYESKWISNEHSRQLVHQWRSVEDAILVGSRTALHDNPQLNVRDWEGRDPVRIVFDRFLRLPDSLKLFDGSQQTLCYNTLKHEEHTNLILVRIEEQGFLEQALHDMAHRNIQSIMVEGGAHTINELMKLNLWDEARVFVSSHTFGRGIAAPNVLGARVQTQKVFSDDLYIYRPWQKN